MISTTSFGKTMGGIDAIIMKKAVIIIDANKVFKREIYN